jgi:hypothetical protein
MDSEIQLRLKQGFIELSTDSGTGSRVLINRNTQRVLKFNQDPAYAHFADFCLQQRLCAASQAQHLPIVYSHCYPLGPFIDGSNIAYSVAELEILEPLSNAERADVAAWIDSAVITVRAGKPCAEIADDPFGVRDTFESLRNEAIRAGHGLDLLKPTNFMKRASEGRICVVFSDPYNFLPG